MDIQAVQTFLTTIAIDVRIKILATVRPYTHNGHCWQVRFDANEAMCGCERSRWPARRRRRSTGRSRPEGRGSTGCFFRTRKRNRR
jgi:hypothetical protein